jgi:hypothetical protein
VAVFLQGRALQNLPLSIPSRYLEWPSLTFQNSNLSSCRILKKWRSRCAVGRPKLRHPRRNAIRSPAARYVRLLLLKAFGKLPQRFRVQEPSGREYRIRATRSELPLLLCDLECFARRLRCGHRGAFSCTPTGFSTITRALLLTLLQKHLLLILQDRSLRPVQPS